MISLFLNNKGQSFDVFKLLIAAVVAVAILVLLLQIIQGINPIGQGDPMKEGSTMIKDLVNQKGSTKTSQRVTFTNGVAISRAGLAGASAELGPDLICVGLGDFAGDDDNWEIVGSTLTYKGSSSKIVKLKAYCNTCRDMADDVIVEDMGLRPPADGFSVSDSDNYSCGAGVGNDSDPAYESATCCVLLLQRSS